jgi:hypothetical protein
MKTLLARRPALSILFLLSAILVSATESDGQTRRKKRTAKPTPPVIYQQPQSEPQVISRAEDFPDQGVQVVPVPVAEPIKAIEDPTGRDIEALRARLNALESSNSKEADQKQKKLLLYLDILTKAEQRAESLRKQLFEMIEKESTVRTRLDSIDLDVRPESIEKNVAMAGSLRPEELRESRRKSLTAEKANLQTLLSDIQRTRSVLDQNLTRADSLVERLRSKLDKDIDDALADDPDKKP